MLEFKCRNIEILSFLKIYIGYLKKHCTNTRLVCTHLNVFFMLKPNMVMKMLNFAILQNACVTRSREFLRLHSESYPIPWMTLRMAQYIFMTSRDVSNFLKTELVQKYVKATPVDFQLTQWLIKFIGIFLEMIYVGRALKAQI